MDVRAGECNISEEAVRVDEGGRQWAKKQYGRRPKLVGGLLTLWVASGLAMFALVGSLFVSETLPDHWYELLLAAIALYSVGPLAIASYALLWSLRLTLAQRRGDYPRNLSDAEVVPTGRIESVEFDSLLGYPVALVHYRDDGGERRARPIFFERDADREVERARAAFRALDAPVESVRATV